MPGLPSIGPVELIIILVIALLILGPGKLPDVGAAFGKTIREFRRASSEVEDATNVTGTSTRPAPDTGHRAEPNALSAPYREPEATPDTSTPTSSTRTFTAGAGDEARS